MSEFKQLLDTIAEIDVDETVTESVLREEDSAEIAYELEEIKDQIIQLAEEAVNMIPHGAGENGMARDRAEAYWYGHILSACGDERYGGHNISMETTIRELLEEGAPEDQM